MNQEKINRINELYKKQKAGTITPEEKDEQSLLRAEYLAAIRNNLRNTLEHTSIQEPDGTIRKLRKKETHLLQKKKCEKRCFLCGILYRRRSAWKKAERLQNDYLHWKNFKKQRWFCHINHSAQKWKRRK